MSGGMGYTVLQHSVLDSRAAQCLTPGAVVLLVDFQRKWSLARAAAEREGRAAEAIPFTYPEFQRPCDRHSFARWRAELLKKGFIAEHRGRAGMYSWSLNWRNYTPDFSEQETLNRYAELRREQRRGSAEFVRRIASTGDSTEGAKCAPGEDREGDLSEGAICAPGEDTGETITEGAFFTPGEDTEGDLTGGAKCAVNMAQNAPHISTKLLNTNTPPTPQDVAGAEAGNGGGGIEPQGEGADVALSKAAQESLRRIQVMLSDPEHERRREAFERDVEETKRAERIEREKERTPEAIAARVGGDVEHIGRLIAHYGAARVLDVAKGVQSDMSVIHKTKVLEHRLAKVS